MPDDAPRDAAAPPRSDRRDIVLHPRTASARRVDRVRATGSRVRGYQSDTDEVLTFGTIAEAGELALAPTASTTAMIALGDALALIVQESRNSI